MAVTDIVKPARILVVANPAAGRDEPILGTLNSHFSAAGIDWDIRITKAAGDARRLAQEAAESGVDVVAAYGGDGTIMEAASGLIGTDVPLLVLPGGTANVMSKELNIPADLAGAVALACGESLSIRSVDMGRMGEQLFMLRITTGLTAEMTKGASREEKNRWGNLAYFRSALAALPNAQVSQITLTLDDETVETEGVICIVANSTNLGVPGLSLSQTAAVDDGLLDVIVIPRTGIDTLLSAAGNALGIESLPHWQARRVSFAADPVQTLECDGEILDMDTFSAEVLPGAVRVVVPASTVESPPENSEEVPD